MPCERSKKLQGEGRKLACQGLTFVPPDGASRLLGQTMNITEASKVLILLLSSRAPPYNKALNWIKFIYNGYRTRTMWRPRQ